MNNKQYNEGFEKEYNEALEKVRAELLEREDQYITFRDLVERFDEVEKEFPEKPWNLLQIYNNFNILIGDKKTDSPDEKKEKIVTGQQKSAANQEIAVPQPQTVELPWKELKEYREACQEVLSALNRIRGIDENVKLLRVMSDTTAGQSELTTAMEEATKRGREDMLKAGERRDIIGTPEYEAEHLKATRDNGLSERQELAISIAMEKWREMEASRNMNHLDERVRLREGIILCLHATRISEEEIQEEIACNGFSSLEPGEVVNMELYIEDGRGKAIDGIDSASSEKDVRYLVRMWGRSPKMDEYTTKEILKRILER